MYADGAPIRAGLAQAVTISPLRLTLASSPAVPLPGERITITLSVSNAGTLAVSGLQPRLAVASGSHFLGSLTAPFPPAAGLNPGGGASFAWTASLTAMGAVLLRATVSGTLAGQGVLVTGAATRLISPPASAQLTARISPDPLTVAGGQWFAVAVTVSNTGGVRAIGVLPALHPAGNAALVAFQAGPVPGKPVALLPGESRRFTFTYSANGSGTVTFSATVEGRADLRPPSLFARAASGAADAGGALARSAVAGSREAAARARTWLFPPRPPEGPERTFLSFESETDLRWDASGYARVELSPDHATDGKSALRVTFLVPSDLTLSATGTFRPELKRTSPARGQEPGLAPDDWSGFTALRADAYLAADRPIDLRLALTDRRGYAWEALRQLPPRSATTVEFDLAGAREARLDLSRLASFSLAVDTSALAARPVVHFDRLRFALPAVPVSSTTAPSSTVAASSGRVK